MHLQDQLRNDAIGRTEVAHGRIAGATEVTVAFADLVGFTKLGERIPAEELGAIAAAAAASWRPRSAHPPVRLVKTIGDAAMLVSPDAGALLDVAIELVRPPRPRARTSRACAPASRPAPRCTAPATGTAAR